MFQTVHWSNREEVDLPEESRCHYCGQTFPDAAILSAHVQEIHVRRDRLSPCLICGATFGSQAELMLHVSQQHLPREGVCENCGFRTATMGCVYCARNLCDVCFDDHVERLDDDMYEGFNAVPV